MFEFESHGTVEDMIKLEQAFIHYLGFQKDAPVQTYEQTAKHYQTPELTAEHEMDLRKQQ